MKKTLIALAVAASAVVSGSAMAWTANGTGGNVELGGTLTPQEKITPWEVQTGAAVTNLDENITKGQTDVVIAVKKAIPVLGIRTVQKTPFQGKLGISPQINYGNAVNLNSFKAGVATITLNVLDPQDNKLGVMTSDLLSAAQSSWSDPAGSGQKGLFAAQAGDAFFGGLGKQAGVVINGTDAFNIIKAINPEFVVRYDGQNTRMLGNGAETFASERAKYSGYYGAGIPVGKKIQIRLDAPAAADAIAWKASLPVTVSYQ
ncbi:fimbrial protein [Salmonella enterica subsp. enterica]|nr:fimbrial protein [Salmonella enterica subsp. enterica]EAW1379243.1 fimbrial protein [Salmonella enterica subsp. enterica]EBQ0453838.1 fimbrial protein [Salmonella enterica subsp. enterica]EBQ0471760.1 fimbrial protein [Salmonella enterica subsp. enterica]EBQ0489610.1 fimbrial protein [Salmonella enterica subsp. enterica]